MTPFSRTLRGKFYSYKETLAFNWESMESEVFSEWTDYRHKVIHWARHYILIIIQYRLGGRNVHANPIFHSNDIQRNLRLTLKLATPDTVIIFHVQARFHTMPWMWNLEWTWDIPTPACRLCKVHNKLILSPSEYKYVFAQIQLIAFDTQKACYSKWNTVQYQMDTICCGCHAYICHTCLKQQEASLH